MSNHPASLTSAASRTPPRWFWPGISLLLFATFLNFWFQTTPVRLATFDDVAFQQVAAGNDTADYLATIAREQGRFFYSTPIYGPALFSLYKVEDPLLFSLFRSVGLFSQILLAGWLAARVMNNPAIGAAVAMGLAGLLHFPATFYLVLSFPPTWIGFAALLGALHCQWSSLHHPTALNRLLSGGLYLLAMLMHDVFVIFLPLFLALTWLRKRKLSDLLRWTLLPLGAALAYVAVHRHFTANFPSAYDGTQFSLTLVPAWKVILRQMIGVTPGFELLVNRIWLETPGPLWRDAAAIGATLRLVTKTDFLLASASGLLLGAVHWQALRTPTPQARLWPWFAGCAALANVPIAFSVKYQIFIMHREFPYGYAWFSYCFLGIALVSGLVWLGGKLPAGNCRLAMSLAISLAGCLFSLSALASNHRVLATLLERYN